jgi:uncharacterized protein involved in exopolysaccharide biosynthesis
MTERMEKCGPDVYVDEISLVELWSTLMRRKVLALAIFLITLLGGVAYLALARPVYESRVVVQVGQLGMLGQMRQAGNSDIEDLDVLKLRLKAEYPALKSVEAPRKGAQNVFTLTLRHGDRDVAGKQLHDIIEQLLAAHNAVFDKAMGALQEQQRALQGRLADSIKQEDELATMVERVKRSEPTLAALLLAEKNGVSRMIVELEEKLTALQPLLVEPITVPSRILGQQVTPPRPLQPNTKMITALSLVLAVLLAVFAVFFAEFLKNAKDGQGVLADADGVRAE